MLITALQDHLEKKVINHEPGTYMSPVLGDLVVLINPAAEASKWTSVQRMLWQRMALVYGERRSGEDYAKSHVFFRDDQRPIVVSATAARNWPPGGRRELDCQVVGNVRLAESDEVQATIDYDWATHDLFPAFKHDMRPLADRIEQWATRSDPSDECSYRPLVWTDVFRHPLRSGAIFVSETLRVLPYMQTDPEETRTIGNLDPPRSPEGTLKYYRVTMKPFGTTHEIRSSLNRLHREDRKVDPGTSFKEIPVSYGEVRSKEAACRVARHWLSRARADMKKGGGTATGWDSFNLVPEEGMAPPALQFTHGFNLGGIAPPTRANDPFWNLRAFDTALAAHDGFMLSSFICAMNQLVLDDVTSIALGDGQPTMSGMN